MSFKIKKMCSLVLTGLFAISSFAADKVAPFDFSKVSEWQSGRWTEQRVWDWYRDTGAIVGCNYLPRTAVNMTEMWQADTFDPKTIHQELGWAHKAGYNSIRVFLQYIVWLDDPAGMKQRIEKLLAIADKHQISVMLVPFCDCAFSGNEPFLGKQNDFVRLNITPEIGGQVIQYALGDNEFFWVNPDTNGKTNMLAVKNPARRDR